MFSEFGFSITMTESEVNKLYRRCCIRFHPDKISQKGIPVTKEDNDKFTRLGNEYETFVNYVKKPSKTESKYYEEAMPQKQQKKPRQRCCGFCRKPGHTRKTCEEFKNHKEKEQAEKETKRKDNESTHRFIIHPEVMVSATITVTFPIPINKKVEDIIIIPYTDLSGKSREHKTKIRYEDLMNGRQTIEVTIPLK